MTAKRRAKASAEAPIDRLKELWDAEGPVAAIDAAKDLRSKSPDDPRLAYLLGRMQLASGNRTRAADELFEAAADSAYALPALVALASCAPQNSLPRVLSLFTTLEPDDRETEEAVYALGLTLWRAGRRGEAIAEWDTLSEVAREAVGDSLESARIAHARYLVETDKPGEALAVLEGLTNPTSDAARPVWRAIAATALRSRQRRLAQRAVEALKDSDDEVDRGLAIAALDSGRDRAERLVELARAAERSAIATWAGTTAVAEQLLQGEEPDTELLSATGDDNTDAALLRFLLRASGREDGDRQADGREPDASRDWATLKLVAADVPALLARLVPEPESGTPLSEAAYWLERAEHEKAHAILTEAQLRDPWDMDIAHNLAVTSYVRATRAAPAVDAEAWQDCICQLSAVLENPRWLGGWVIDRHTVYGADEIAPDFTDELRQAIYRHINRHLDRLRADALATRDEPSAEAAQLLLAAFARERQAAASMAKARDFRDPNGNTAAFGPLFVHRTGQTEALLEYFAEHPPREREEPSELLASLLRSMGMSDAPLRQMLDADEADPHSAMRRWFSELGEAASLRDAGDTAAARERALAVYARWTPPDQPSVAEFEAANPAYVGMAGGQERLRSDAAAMACELSVEQFSQLLGSPSVEAAAVAKEAKRILQIAAALGREDDARYRLSRLYLGKVEECVEDGSLSQLRLACALLKHADKAGLRDLERRRAEALSAYGMALYKSRRWRHSIEVYEEAWTLSKEREYIPCNLVAVLLHEYDALRTDQREREARQVLDRATEVAREAVEAFPEGSHARELPTQVRMIQMGAGQMVFHPDGEETEDPPSMSEMPSGALEAVRACRECWRTGDLDAALRQARKAHEAAPNHPDAAALLANACLQVARQRQGAEGRSLFDEAVAILEPMRRRYASHERLRSTSSIAARDRVLYHSSGPVSELHRKALLLYFDERFAEAAAQLKVVLRLREESDPEVLSLLAAALVANARRHSSPSSWEDSQDLRYARKVLALGRELAPDHYAMEKTRQQLSSTRTTKI